MIPLLSRLKIIPSVSVRTFASRYAPLFLGFIMVSALGAGIYFSAVQSNLFAIRAIPLEWKTRLDQGRMEIEIAREIEAGIGTQFAGVLGKRPWEISLNSLTRSIQMMPWIRDAQIQRVFPDRLVVSITPKSPLAVIASLRGGGNFRPISQDGELMPAWESDVIPDVPFLRGDEFSRNGELRNRAVQLVRALPHEGVLARSNIAEISWSARESKGLGTIKPPGFSILLLSPRTEILLGDTEIETKLARVHHVLNYLSSEGKRAPVIDSTSVKKVVVRAHHRP